MLCTTIFTITSLSIYLAITQWPMRIEKGPETVLSCKTSEAQIGIEYLVDACLLLLVYQVEITS